MKIIIAHNWSKLDFLNFKKLLFTIKSKILLKSFNDMDGAEIFFPELGHVSRVILFIGRQRQESVSILFPFVFSFLKIRFLRNLVI